MNQNIKGRGCLTRKWQEENRIREEMGGNENDDDDEEEEEVKKVHQPTRTPPENKNNKRMHTVESEEGSCSD